MSNLAVQEGPLIKRSVYLAKPYEAELEGPTTIQ